MFGRKAVVLDGVLHQQLQHGRRNEALALPGFGAYLRGDAFAVAHFHQIEVGVEEADFVGYGYQVAIQVGDDVAIDFRQVVQELACKTGLFFNQCQQVVEVVEHEVRIDLQLQRVELRLQCRFLLFHQRHFERLLLVACPDVGLQVEGIGIDARQEGGYHGEGVGSLHVDKLVKKPVFGFTP